MILEITCMTSSVLFQEKQLITVISKTKRCIFSKLKETTETNEKETCDHAGESEESFGSNPWTTGTWNDIHLYCQPMRFIGWINCAIFLYISGYDVSHEYSPFFLWVHPYVNYQPISVEPIKCHVLRKFIAWHRGKLKNWKYIAY